MSYVTTLILSIDTIEDEIERLKDVNCFFEQQPLPPKGFVYIDDETLPNPYWYGGNKALQCQIAVGAFNHLRLDDFIQHLGSIQWESPEDVQLFIKDEHDTKFRVAYGKEEYDERLFPRNMLLVDAEDIFQEIARSLPPDTFAGTSILADIQEWLNKHNELRKKEDE